MFANDTFSAKSANDLTTLINFVNVEINKMATWFRANKLAVNKTKTKYIIFRAKGKKINDNLPAIIFDENEPNSPFNPNLSTPLESYLPTSMDMKKWNAELTNCWVYIWMSICL